MSRIMVSICCLAYNHEKYIRECLDGFLSQKCDFEVEVLIHDDASSDNTADIIREYEAKYPNLIKPIYQSENQYSKGIKPTFKYNFPRAKGKYIAMCEGDDYWADSLKLQKQVELMEKNPSYSACFTNALIIDEDNKNYKEKFISHSGDKVFSMEDAAKSGGGFFPTASLLFRNKLEKLPSFFFDVKSGDRALILLLANIGEIYFLNEITCVYRKHGGGIYTSIEHDYSKRLEIDLNNMNLLNNFNEFTNHKYQELIKTLISNYSQRILTKYPKELIKHLRPKLMRNLLIIDKIRLFKNAVFVPGKR